MRYYSDDEIRGMLIERKRRQRKRAAIAETIGGIIGWASIFAFLYMVSILGYAAGLN